MGKAGRYASPMVRRKVKMIDNPLTKTEDNRGKRFISVLPATEDQYAHRAKVRGSPSLLRTADRKDKTFDPSETNYGELT